jgi:hypothetical protein
MIMDSHLLQGACCPFLSSIKHVKFGVLRMGCFVMFAKKVIIVFIFSHWNIIEVVN